VGRAPAVGRSAQALDVDGRPPQLLRDHRSARRLGSGVARRDLPQTCGAPDAQELSARSVLSDDGHYEYSAITTNKDVGGPALWHFAAGRGAQEKTIAELKGEFALDAVPSRDYGANSAWQQLSILAHNLLKGFQLDTLAPAKPRSPKRTASYLLQNMRTLRFELIARAARLCRPQGRRVLRLKANPRIQQLYEDVSAALAA